jgi:hypothetical protein
VGRCGGRFGDRKCGEGSGGGQTGREVEGAGRAEEVGI